MRVFRLNVYSSLIISSARMMKTNCKINVFLFIIFSTSPMKGSLVETLLQPFAAIPFYDNSKAEQTKLFSNMGQKTKHFPSLWRIQNELDKVIVKQEIDRILIHNLQLSLNKIEKLVQTKHFQRKNEMEAGYINQLFSKSRIYSKTNLEFDNLKKFENLEKKSEIDETLGSDSELLIKQIGKKIDLQIKIVVFEEIKNFR